MVAHQLIWNTETYTRDVEVLDDFGQIAAKLKEEICNRFDDQAKKLYQEEFEFFDLVTKISGTLQIKVPPSTYSGAAIKELRKVCNFNSLSHSFLSHI